MPHLVTVQVFVLFMLVCVFFLTAMAYTDSHTCNQILYPSLCTIVNSKIF